ncbi:hypothetical protein BGX26_007461, partial [Mortierella sp. AD094]
MERALSRLTATCVTRVHDANQEYNTNTNTIIGSLDRKVTERKQAHMKQQKEYQKKKLTTEQMEVATAFIKGQLNTELARMKAEAQRSVDRTASKRDILLKKIEVYREQQTRLIRNAFDARMRLYIQQEQKRRDAFEARARLRKQQEQERRDARENLRLKREQVHQATLEVEARLHYQQERKRQNANQARAKRRFRREQERLQLQREKYGKCPLKMQYRRHMDQEEELPEPDLVRIGPVYLSPAEAANMMTIHTSPVDNTKPRVISSDGSLININTENVAMAFGVVDLSQPVTRTVHGRTDGHASSAKAELMGLLAAIISAPPDQDVRIELDNQAVVQQFQQLVHLRLDTLPRKRIRSTYAGLWAVIHNVVQERAGTVEVAWVRGHSNNIGNNQADIVATTAARRAIEPWRVDL